MAIGYIGAWLAFIQNLLGASATGTIVVTDVTTIARPETDVSTFCRPVVDVGSSARPMTDVTSEVTRG